MHHKLTRRLTAPTAAAALVAAVIAIQAPSSAKAAVPDTIPLQVTNNSGRGDAVYVYTIGTLLSTGQQGWADANGTFHTWPAGGIPPTPAPDASIPGPAAGQSTTIPSKCRWVATTSGNLRITTIHTRVA